MQAIPQSDLFQCLGGPLPAFAARQGLYCRPVITFSKADTVAIRWNCWNTKPMRAARRTLRCRSPIAFTSPPSYRIIPEVGMSSVPSNDNSVLLPEPDGPTMATSSPRSMASDVSCNISSTLPSLPGNAFITCSNVSNAPCSGPAGADSMSFMRPPPCLPP